MFTLTIVVASVALVQLVLPVVGGTGAVARAGRVLAGVGAFAVAAWATFYGGAERLWEAFLERTDTEW